MYIDTHCHVNFKDFKDDYEEVIERALSNETWMILVGSKMDNNLRAMDIAKNYDKGVYAAIGVHPLHVRDHKVYEVDPHSGKKISFTAKAENFNIDEYYKLIKDSIKEVPVQRSFIANNAWGRVVAIGETGLDYYHLPENLSRMEKEDLIDTQKEYFHKHIDLALKLDLPLIVHCRGSKDQPDDAYNDLIKLLKDKNVKGVQNYKGVVHCYGGNFEQAQELIDLGFHLGFTGVVTFDKTGHYDSLIKKLPIKKILIETDSPYLTPSPYRGKRNEPVYVKRVAEFIAKTKNLSLYEVENITTENAMKLFKLRY